MSKVKDPDSPRTTSVEYDAMAPRWAKVDAVLGGTEALREASTAYLPMHPEESADAYEERLAAATLLNLTELTLDGWVGRPFGDPVKKNDDIPKEISDLFDNIDLQGNALETFLRNWFRTGIAKAYAHVLVEFPQAKQQINLETGQVMERTLADDRQENMRPYFVSIKPENLIFAHAEVINGVEVLKHIRILEEVEEMVGFAQSFRTQIRIIEPGRQEIWEMIKEKGKKERWKKTQEFVVDIDVVPLVTFYANREGFMMGKSPLADLCDLNIAHWQSSSDQRAVLTVARFPILALSGGVDDENALTIGPNQWLFTPDPQGRYYYVEHSGKAIEAGRKDLLDLEEQMGNYGAAFLKKQPGSRTATARALDSAESTSPLQDITVRFMDAVNTALDFMAKWMKIKGGGGTIEITTDFGPEGTNQSDLNILKVARRLRDISREAFIKELQRRGVLMDEFDVEADLEKIEQELLNGIPMVPTAGEGADEDNDTLGGE